MISKKYMTSLLSLDVLSPQDESLPLECMSQPKYNWTNPGQMTTKFRALLDESQNLTMDELNDQMATLVWEHMLSMYAVDDETPMVEVPFVDEEGDKQITMALIPVASVDESGSHHLQIENHLSSGANGDIFWCQFQDHEQDSGLANQKKIIKFINATLDGDDDRMGEIEETFLNEIFMQSILHCMMEDNVVPNPIPPIWAPLYIFEMPFDQYDADEDTGSFAAVMSNAGITFKQVLNERVMTAPRLFVMVAILASHLQRLQAKVRFQHCDMHAGNVLVRKGPLYSMPFGKFGSRATDYYVSIIDFGYTCIDINGHAFSTTFDENDDVFTPQCLSRNPASDLFVFLSSIILNVHGKALSPDATDFVISVKSFVNRTIRTDGLEFPPVREWNDKTPTLEDLYIVSADAKSTTPENVMQWCLSNVPPPRTLPIQGPPRKVPRVGLP